MHTRTRGSLDSPQYLLVICFIRRDYHFRLFTNGKGFNFNKPDIQLGSKCVHESWALGGLLR